ncbi:MAG: pyridoxamine 5'-phosphate oxidase [Rhodobacteraceae bacterium]|nr:pyridoxamine 5'-phosphate oxidase [Paracoccaceae bacterium]
MTTPSDIAFSPAVKAQQRARGSRDMFARMEEKRPWSDVITPDLAQFIGTQTSVFLGSASADGQPYIQHRGGPAGFLKVLGDRQLGFADLAGNRQYITLGNLSENPQVILFLVDYTHQRRIKMWGQARVVEDDPDLVARLSVEGGSGRAERAILFDVATWDVNCPKHIPQMFHADDVARVLAARDEKIARLEAQLAALTGKDD